METTYSPAATLQEMMQAASLLVKQSSQRLARDFVERTSTFARLHPRRGFSGEVGKSDLIYLLAMRTWGLSGFNTFKLTPELIALLQLTNFEAAEDSGSAPAPFESFLLQLPENAARVGNAGFVRTIFVTRGKSAARELCVDVENDDPAVLAMELAFPDGTEQTVVLVLPLWRPNTECEREYSSAELICGTTDSQILAAQRLVFGLCSFIATKVEPLKEDDPGRRQRMAMIGRKEPKVFTVGRTVKISRELRDIAARHDGPPLWSLKHRFIVRGHWRNQAVGPNRSERRKTWIAPHWKGPEGAEAWRHIYEPTLDS